MLAEGSSSRQNGQQTRGVPSTLMPSSFTGARAAGRPEVSQEKMAAFRRIKPTCVSLMGIAQQGPTAHSSHAMLLNDLTRQVEDLHQSAFSLSLINYILFPVTNILRHSSPQSLPESFLEAAFKLLNRVVKVWRLCETGIDVPAWEQLWKFTSLAVGPRVGGGDKGKGRAVGQDVQLRAVELLQALSNPSAIGDGPQHPTSAMRKLCDGSKSPMMPTLFQTITFLLETSNPSPPHLQLQLRSIRLLRSLICSYLQGQSAILAAILPGTVSAMSKLVHHGAAGLKGEVAGEIAGLLGEVILETLGDDQLRSIGVLNTKVHDIAQLADEWDGAETIEAIPPNRPPPSPTLSHSSRSTDRNDPFPPLTASYLAFTSNQLLSAIHPLLSSLAGHPSYLARQGVCGLARQLVAKCRESLPMLVPYALAALLLLSKDAFDPVRCEARSQLVQLLSDSSTASQLDDILLDLLSNAVSSLPRLIVSQLEAKVGESTRLIVSIADLTIESSTSLTYQRYKNPIGQLLGPNGRIERWSWALLNCLELGRPQGWSASGNPAANAAQRGWQQGFITSSSSKFIEDGRHDGHFSKPVKFPGLPLRYIEASFITENVNDMLVALGMAGGTSALHAVEYLMLFAKANRRRHVSKAVSALYVAQRLLEGAATAEETGVEGRIGKATRRMAKDLTKMVILMDEDEEDEDDGDLPLTEPQSEALLLVERTKGIDALTTLLDRRPLADSHSAAETRRLHAQAQRGLLTALSLSTLALTARILGSSFRVLLLTTLYTLLAHMTSSQPLVAEYAEIALAQVSYHCGYALPQNMVLDNVDYVINVVSQRLTHQRLSSTAPLVLIAMIRFVGAEIVPLVHDIVDEIFDALDDYHGYETLASGLLAVLVTLIDVMAADVQSNGPSSERSEKLAEIDRLSKPPEPVTDFNRFVGWYGERASRQQREIQEILDRAPQHAWGKAKEEEEAAESGAGPAADEQRPPTRTEEVCAQILEKSSHFLSHQSPFLRSRILALIARATPVLAAGNREQDLLPIIDRSWGLILLRLEDEYPYVVTEAAEVIASLCEHVGDYMSRRILEHAWPRMCKLLNAQRELDKKSALARRGAIGTDTAYTVSHRLHVAILRTASFIAQETPVSDNLLWEMMVLFRPFLDVRAHDELRTLAKQLYLKLGSRDGDAVWVVLQATMGSLGDDRGVWAYLRDQTVELEGNAESLLKDI